jgi:hypothetical protein
VQTHRCSIANVGYQKDAKVEPDDADRKRYDTITASVGLQFNRRVARQRESMVIQRISDLSKIITPVPLHPQQALFERYSSDRGSTSRHPNGTVVPGDIWGSVTGYCMVGAFGT